MKRVCFVLAVLLSSLAFADDFTNILQDLAMQTACLGKYSNAEAGNYSIPDPHDYYTPEMMAQRFSKMSGNRTRIQTFYGICFDYAQAAWDDIKRYQASYNRAGMRNQEWYIAAVDDNPNYITLYDPIPDERVQWNGYGYVDKRDGKYLRKLNGVYCKKKSDKYVTAHGSNTTYHAWLWVQRTNGTWYWIDPTWTDNTGYVWYGKVSGDREIELTPDMRYCVTTPPSSYIADNKQKPSTQNTRPKSSNTSNYRNYNTFGTFALTFSPSATCFNQYYKKYNSADDDNINDIADDANSEPLTQFDLSFGIDAFGNRDCGCFVVDWIYDEEANSDELTDKTNAILFGHCYGLRLTSWFALYGGGGIGWYWNETSQTQFDSKKGMYVTEENKSNGFAYKVNGGIMIPIATKIDLKFDVSWNNICGLTYGIGFGYNPFAN